MPLVECPACSVRPPVGCAVGSSAREDEIEDHRHRAERQNEEQDHQKRHAERRSWCRRRRSRDRARSSRRRAARSRRDRRHRAWPVDRPGEPLSRISGAHGGAPPATGRPGWPAAAAAASTARSTTTPTRRRSPMIAPRSMTQDGKFPSCGALGSIHHTTSTAQMTSSRRRRPAAAPGAA